jgi:hypothetical protein
MDSDSAPFTRVEVRGAPGWQSVPACGRPRCAKRPRAAGSVRDAAGVSTVVPGWPVAFRGGHTDPVEVLRDAGRYTRLVARGWRIYRYTRFDVYGDPGGIVAELTRALATSRTA